MQTVPRSLNVSLDQVERRAIERLHARLRERDPIKYRHLSDVVRELIRERMIREYGPDWHRPDGAASNGRAA